MTATTSTLVTFIVPLAEPFESLVIEGPPPGQWTPADATALLPNGAVPYAVVDGVLVVHGQPAISGPPQGEWTYEAWATVLPDDGNRYEIIDGVLYVTTAPSYFHQWVIRRLDHYLGIPAEEQGLAFAATAPIGLFMPGCAPVQPDFVVIRADNASIIRERRIIGVPDLIVEVLSPNNPGLDRVTKLQTYARAGVPEYAIVHPAARTLSYYRLVAPGQYGEPQVMGERETITFACLPTLPLRVRDLFAGAPDTTV